jgi:CubicO group peptidase (beta-lactamase class C family)
VVDCWAGTRDEEGSPWEAETLSLSFSTSKGVASTLLHILADRGLVDYDDPVAEYWPEFAQAGKDRITVRQILCHEAGLYDIRSLVDTATRMLDWGYMVEALADGIPIHEPGTAHGYHGFTYGWLVGELIQRVTGKSFNDVLKAEIADPLDLDGLFVGLPAEHMHRRAQLLLPAVMRREGEALERLGAWVRGMNRLLKFLRMPLDLAHLAGALSSPRARWRRCTPCSRTTASSLACGSCSAPRCGAPARCRIAASVASSPSRCTGGWATTAFPPWASRCRTGSATSASAGRARGRTPIAIFRSR